MQQEQKLQSVKKQEQAWKRELELEQQRQRQSSSRSRHWARTMATLHLCPLGAPTVCAEIKAKLKPDSLNGKRGGEEWRSYPESKQGAVLIKCIHCMQNEQAERYAGRASWGYGKRLLFHFAGSLTAFALLIDALLGTYVLCELLYLPQPRPCRLYKVPKPKKVRGSCGK